MKVSDSTVPIILLELIAGMILLSVIIASTSLVENRTIALSTPHSQPLQKSASETFLTALAALEKKIDAAYALKKEPQISLPSLSQEQIEVVIDDRLGQIMPRFAELDGKIDMHFSARNDAVESRITALDTKIKSLQRDDDISQMLGDLNRKTELLSAERDTAISPSLKMLTTKVDLLLHKRNKKPAAIVTGSSVMEDTFVKLSPAEAAAQMALHAQDILVRYGIDSTIDPRNNSLQLSRSFDFKRGSPVLFGGQTDKISKLADSLAEIFLCYANSLDERVMEMCQNSKNPVALNAVVIKVFSVGGNVGTKRFNYNWRLASSRSVEVLKAIVSARPDLLEFANRDGLSMFSSIAELTKIGANRSRRIELQFVVSNN